MTDGNAFRDVRCFLLDMDGTFCLGERLLDGALRFIQVLRQQRREFLFLTNNSSKDSQQYAEKITGLGLASPREKVLISGEATAIHLQRQKPAVGVYVVWTPALEDAWLFTDTRRAGSRRAGI